MGTLAKQLQPMTRPTKCQDTKGMAFTPSSEMVGRIVRRKGNRTPQAASSRPTLGKRAQYPHRKCPPKPRLPRHRLYSCHPKTSCDVQNNFSSLVSIRDWKPHHNTLTNAQGCPVEQSSTEVSAKVRRGQEQSRAALLHCCIQRSLRQPR